MELTRRHEQDPTAELRQLRGRVELLVDARKRLENQLRESNERLEESQEALKAAHEELGSFSYSVSHDLCTPLAAVQGYIQFFLEDHAKLVPAAGVDLLREATDAAVRMRRLIEDLETYSRFTRQPLEKFVVPLKPLVEHVVQVLLAREPGRQVETHVEELGECACDLALMEEVFMQLVGNALKYSRGRDPAIIRVQRLPQENTNLSVFQVSDNGAGFDMQYAHKLFGVFQRLHPVTQFEGRGIGLSIVQRIIQRHGGRVWADGAPGQGATFYFSLPDLP